MEIVPILTTTVVFATIFGIVYIVVTARNKERMALIEKGADPKFFESAKTSSKSSILKWGLLLAGSGFGLFLGGILVGGGMLQEGAAYAGMMSLFGGLGLIVAYRIERQSDKSKEKE